MKMKKKHTHTHKHTHTNPGQLPYLGFGREDIGFVEDDGDVPGGHS